MIRVYDFEYNLLAETEHSFSSEWELKFNGIGSYEGSFDINSDFTKVFAENRYLILCEEDNQAICVGRRISDKLTVYGRTPEWLMSKRVVLPFKTSEIFGTDTYLDPETIILYLLNEAYKEPKKIAEDGSVDSSINTDAVAEDFIIPEPIGAEKLTRHFWRNSANPLSDVIKDLCDLWGCGYKVRFNHENKCWDFSFVFGEKRDIVISKSLKNAYDMSLSDSLLERVNGGVFKVYAGEDTEVENYGYIQAGSAANKGMLYWETVLASASGISEAEKLIKSSAAEETVDCEVKGAVYGEDYSLGDEIRVQFEAGPFRTTLRLKVTGISIINSSSGKSIKPVFSAL